MKSSVNRSVLWVVLPYLVFGGLWIIISDRALILLGLDIASYARVSIAKGWAFVLVTAILLAFLLRVQFQTRARNEDALRQERDFSNAVLDALPGVVFCYDDKLRFRRWNQKFIHVSGYTEQEVASMPPFDFFPEAQRGLLAQRIREVFDRGYSAVEADFVAKDGSLTPFYLTGIATTLEGRPHMVGVGIDISQRRRAEAALMEREECYRAVFEQAAVGMARSAPDGQWLEVNQRLCDIVGYTRDELLALKLQDITHPEDLQRALDQVRLLLEGLISSYTLEKRLFRKDGNSAWVRLSVTLVREVSGLPKYLIAIVEDITDRKRAEVDRDAETRRNANLVHALGQVVYEHDVVTDKIVWFGQTEKLLGYKPEEMGQTVAEWLRQVHREDAAKLVTQLEAPSEQKLFEGACRYRHKAGHYIWTFDRGIIQRDTGGRIVQISGILWDITERKEAEARLAESEERLRLALESARMGTFDWNLISGRIIWSRWHEVLWGFAPGEFAGTYEAFCSRIHPEDLPGINSEVARCISTRDRFRSELRVVWPDQSVHWIQGAGEFTFDAAGKPERMRGTVTEVTERKQAEDDLRHSREQLRALTGRLETLREEERTRISRKIHDELGQMLTALKMDLRWIEHGLDAFGTDRRLNPVLDKLAETGELVDATVRTVQHISAELRPGILDKLGLGTALEYEAARFQERSGISCRVSIPDSEPALDTEVTTAFFRIFQEALTNIARHARATAVEVELKCEQKQCRLAVRDNGRGLTGMDLVSPKSLGLLGMRERARLLGGDLVFTAPTGGGTVLNVHIPIVPLD